MERILFHGSDHIIEKPKYNYGNKNNDYGLGFYCTTNLDLAKEWATRINNTGFVNKYSLRDDRFNILDLTSDEYDVLNWVALLMNNRSISKDLKSRGMKFVGSTIIYSYLQAIGVIYSHDKKCFMNNYYKRIGLIG